RRHGSRDLEPGRARYCIARTLDLDGRARHPLRADRRITRKRVPSPPEHPPMTPLLAIVRVTARQLTGRSRVLGFGLLNLMPAVLLAAASRSAESTALDLEFGVLLVVPLFALVIPITTLILASSALGDERRDKTMSFLLLRPVSRLEIVVAKMIAAAGVSIGFALWGALA